MSTVIKEEITDDDTSSENMDSSSSHKMFVRNEAVFIKHETICGSNNRGVDDGLTEEIIIEPNYEQDRLELSNSQTGGSFNQPSDFNTNLSEFILLNTPPDGGNQVQEYVSWNIIQTKVLINLYTKYINKIGTPQLRSMKKLWEVIAKHINENFDITVTGANCENKWRVLERGYKNYVGINKTRRKRKNFEFFEEMDRIFKIKGILNSETINTEISNKEIFNRDPPHQDVSKPSSKEMNEIVEKEIANVSDVRDVGSSNVAVSPVPLPKNCGESKKKSKLRLDRNVVLNNIRKDRLLYQKEKLKLEMEKLEAMKRHNDLYAERNNILKKRFNIGD